MNNKTFIEVINNEKLRLVTYKLNEKEVTEKFKKTYKNRYYIKSKS